MFTNPPYNYDFLSYYIIMLPLATVNYVFMDEKKTGGIYRP